MHCLLVFEYIVQAVLELAIVLHKLFLKGDLKQMHICLPNVDVRPKPWWVR
jgi:hypothetical protein